MLYSYAYAALIVIMGVVWMVFYMLRKDLRHEQLVMSFLIMPFSVTQYWFYQDYWRPEYILPSIRVGQIPIGIEESLFVFFVSGITAIMYEVIFRKRHATGKKRPWALLFIVGGALFFVGLIHMGIQSIWASSIASISMALPILYIDQEVRADSILTAVSMFIFVLAVYSFWFALFPVASSHLWVTSAFSGKMIFGIPIEEMVWYVSWSFFGSVFYEFWINAKEYSRKGIIS